MVVTQLMGGLGNQLFQYAMGKVISLRNNTELQMDTSFFEGYEWHVYSLAPFSINASIATKEFCQTLKDKDNQFVNRIIKKVSGRNNYLVTEKNLLFNESYHKLVAPVYISGYWQCENYFKHVEADIRREAVIRIPPSAPNLLMLDRIKNSNAVSLHIRRGNFVNVASVNAVHGTCSMDYYREAMRVIENKMPDPVYFVFSDDIQWARTNLKSDKELVFVDLNDDLHDYEDMRLMSSCKNHIIANSTFSWWGAWLNPAQEKLVVAPAQWFADEEKNKTAATIVPENWIKI